MESESKFKINFNKTEFCVFERFTDSIKDQTVRDSKKSNIILPLRSIPKQENAYLHVRVM